MDIFNIDKISLLIIFFIPGFTSIRTWMLIVPSENKKSSEYLLEAVTYSCFNFAIIGWSLSLVYTPSFKAYHNALYYIYTVIILIVLPILYPILFNKILNLKFVKKLIINPIGKSWDYFFGLKGCCFVLIHTKNKKMIGGVYSTKSFASSYPFTEDIYLEETWKIDSNGKFIEKIIDSKGMWISKDNIEYVEFFNGEK